MSLSFNLFAKLGLNSAGFETGMKRAEKRVGIASKKFAGLTRSVRGLSGAMAGVSFALVGRNMVRVTADFQAGLNKVQSLTSATAGEMAKLSATAKELGITTKFSATEAADAMGFLGMAGFRTSQIIGAMPSTLQLAAAANMDLARAADLTSNILTGYGLEVKDLAKANDVLTKAFTSSNTDLEMLGAAFVKVGPIAKALNITLEETTATLGNLAQGGIRGEEGGTALRNVLLSLAKPTAEAEKALDDLGVSIKDASGNFVGLISLVEQLERASTGFTSIEFAEKLNEIFGKRGVAPISVLISQSAQSLDNFTRSLEDSGGTAERVANKQMEGLRGAFLEARSAWEGLVLSLTNPESSTGASAGLERLVDTVAGQLRGLAEIFSGVSFESSIQLLGFKIAKAMAKVGYSIIDGITFAGDFALHYMGAIFKMIAHDFGIEITRSFSLAMAEGLKSLPIAGGPLASQMFKAIANMNLDKGESNPGTILSEALGRAKGTDFASTAGQQWDANIAALEAYIKLENEAWESSIINPENPNSMPSRAALGAELIASLGGAVVDTVEDANDATKALMTDIASGVSTMASALEDGLLNAAREGKAAFGDMAQFVLAEINRILLRALVLRPLFTGIGDMFPEGSALGTAFSTAFGGPKAMGGPVSGGKTYMVGERGPELLTMGSNGYVTPNHKLGGGPTIYADMRGASMEAVQRLEQFVGQLNGSIEERALSAFSDARRRIPEMG